MAEAEAKFNVDPQTGFAATIWNSWETNWSGMTSVVEDTRRRTDSSSHTFGRGGWINGGSGGPAAWVRQTTSQTVEETVRNTTEEGTKSRTGTTTMVVEEFEEIDAGDKVLNTEVINIVRSRNVEFYAKNLKPSYKNLCFL